MLRGSFSCAFDIFSRLNDISIGEYQEEETGLKGLLQVVLAVPRRHSTKPHLICATPFHHDIIHTVTRWSRHHRDRRTCGVRIDVDRQEIQQRGTTVEEGGCRH